MRIYRRKLLLMLRRAPAATAAPKKVDAPKVKVPKEENKGTRLFSEPWCDYVVVSNTLEGLAPVAISKSKPEPRDTADIPVQNPDDPIDLYSSPEPLLRTKAMKRKQSEGGAMAQPVKKIGRKKIGKKGNLDAFVAKVSPEKPIPPAHQESSVFNDDFPLSPPRTSIKEQLESTQTVEAGVEKAVEVEKTVEVELEAEKVVEAETVDTGATKPKSRKVVAHGPERGKSIIEEEVPVITVLSSTTTSAPPRDNVEENPIHVDQGFVGIFPPAEVKFQEERSHDHTYRSYLEETASSTSTTHRIVREWRRMHREWDAFEASKKEVAEEKAKVAELRAKLDADQAKFESEQRIEEWSTMGWKKKAESEAEIERFKKEKAEAEAARDKARSHRERSEQREVQTYATLALRNKEIEELSLLTDQEQTKAELESAKKYLQLERVKKAEAVRRLTETEEKLECSETARVTAESLVEPLKNDMLWMQHHGNINVANSILNSIDLDLTIAHLMVTARNDGYAQGYAECTQHVTDVLRVDWDNSRCATRGVNTGAAHAAVKAEYNNLSLPVMDLVTTTSQSEDFVTHRKEIFPNEADASDDEDLE
ncbi:hypothetical protein HanPI659440_Chr11g0412011 [Helianthus annuus]|nr:hypothetical protein HanPI659440_Chr11g0412011 [Helianthus annuus]